MSGEHVLLGGLMLLFLRILHHNQKAYSIYYE